MTENPMKTFDDYVSASSKAWRTYRDYQFGDASPREVKEANRREAVAEAAHRAAIARVVDQLVPGGAR